MSTQTLLGQTFPTPCKRCGGALYREVDYCPYCGAVHPLDMGSHKRAVIPGSRASATGRTLPHSNLEPPPLPTSSAASSLAPASKGAVASAATSTAASTTANATASSNVPRVMPELPPPVLASPDIALSSDERASRWIGLSSASLMKLMLGIVIAVAIVLAFVGYQLFTGNRDDQSNDAESGNTATQDARTTTGTIAPFTPTQSTQSAGQNTAARGTPNANATANVAPPKSGNSGNSVKVPTPAPSAPFALATPPALALTPAKPAPTPVLPVTPVAPPAPQFRDAAQAMQTARQAIRTNDISTAQAALGAAQTLQPGNADAQSLLNDIKPLAARRDAALQAAQTCVAQQSWPCARQHANEALTIDTGNTTAKTILERVIRETGWAPLNLHGATATTPQTAPLTQQAPSPNNNAPATASRSGPAAADVNAAEARERAIRDSGWSRSSAAGAGAKPSASAPAAMAAATTTATSTSTSPGK